MKIILIGILTLSLSSCMISSKDSSQINPVRMNQWQNSTSGIIDDLAIVTPGTVVPSTGAITSNHKKNMKTYDNSYYGVSFDYPSEFTIESNSWVMSWDMVWNIDEFEDNLVFSGARGGFALIFPNDTVQIGRAPLYGKKDEMINIWRFQVQKHIEFWSQDNPGPNQQWIWVLKYTVEIDDKKYRFQTSQEGIFWKYSISEELELIIQDIIKSIK